MPFGKWERFSHHDNNKVCKLYKVQIELGNSVISVSDMSKYLKCFILQIELGNSLIGDWPKESTLKQLPAASNISYGILYDIP